MNYSKSVLLYQDKPKFGLLLKAVLILPLAFLVLSIYLWSTGETSGSLAFLIEAFIIGLVFWCVFPREYRVYEDHLRISLGSPFSVKVGFQKIETIQITNKTSFTVNFVTRITRNYVVIKRKGGLNIAITPTDADAFVNNANSALKNWLTIRSETGAA